MPPKKKLAKAFNKLLEIQRLEGLDLRSLLDLGSVIKTITITDENQSDVNEYLAKWADKLVKIPDILSPESIAFIIERCGELNFLYQPLMDKSIGLISSAAIQNYSTNQLAAIMKGLARLDYYDKPFMQSCVSELNRDGKLNEANSHDLSTILWSLAKLRYQDAEFSYCWFDLANDKIRSFTLEDLCQSIQGIAKLEYYDKTFISRWIEKAMEFRVRSFDYISKLNNAYYLTMIKLNSAGDDFKANLDKMIFSFIGQVRQQELINIEDKRQFLISFNFLPEAKKSELNFNLVQLKEGLEAVSTTHVSDLQRNILDKVQKIKLASKQETAEGWTVEHKISLGQKVDSEYWVEEIFNYVDIFVPEIRSVIQVDGHHAHYYRNNGASNATTNFNSKMLEFYGYSLLRGNEGALTKKALKEFLLPLFKEKAAAVRAAEAKSEELYANDDSESYPLPLLSSSDEEEWGASEGSDSGSSLKVRAEESLSVATSSGKLQKTKAEQDSDDHRAMQEAKIEIENEQEIIQALSLAVFNQAIGDVQKYKEYISKCPKPLVAMAVFKQNFAMVKYLLEHHANPNLLDGRGNSAVHIAVEKDNYQMLELLAEHDARLNTRNKQGQTPFMVLKNKWLQSEKLNDDAYENNLMNITMFFIAHKIVAHDSLNFNNTVGNTLLHLAALHGHNQAVKIMLQDGDLVNTLNNEGDTPLHSAVGSGHVKVVNTLLSKGASVSILNNNQCSPLYFAAHNGHDDLVKILLQHQAPVNSKNALGATPLHIAAHYGFYKVVEILLKGGAEINSKDNNGYTSLHLAAQKGRAEVVKTLLEGGAEINTQDKEGYTALHLASEHGRYEVVEILLNANAEINALDKGGFTALHRAACHGRYEVVETLLKGGAKVDVIDNKGHIPLYLAILYGHCRVVELLLEKGSSLDVKFDGEITPLELASLRGNVDLVKLLLSKEQGLNSGWSYKALGLASLCGHAEVVDFLNKYIIDLQPLSSPDEKLSSAIAEGDNNPAHDHTGLMGSSEG